MRTAIFIPTDMITVWSPVDVSKLPNNNLQKYISKYKVGRYYLIFYKHLRKLTIHKTNFLLLF